MIEWSLCGLVLISLVYFLRIRGVRVRAGPPPMGSLFFAYMYYGLGGSPKKGSVDDLASVYPGRKIKLCYHGAQSGQTEFAEGVLLNEDSLEIGTEHLTSLFDLGASLFKAPLLNHAVYAEFPLIPFFPLVKWMAIVLGYPKLNSYIKNHNLCAYPFIEIYSRFRLLVVVPLVRQDDYVVKEAEPMLFGKTRVIPVEPFQVEKKKALRPVKRTNKG